MTERSDPRERFTEAADDYARFRPSYPSVAIDWIVAESAIVPGSAIADIGCGTGIASRLFSDRGFHVTGIDPNEEMLRHARSAGGPIRYQRGESTATGLPDASFDLALSAQAFHWFDVPPTIVELARILRPPRPVAVFWNIRDEGAKMEAYEALLVEHSPEYRDHFAGPSRARVRNAEAARQAIFRWEDALDWETFLGRVRSSSYVVHGVPVAGWTAFEAALQRFFDAHAAGGRLAWPYRTEVTLFRAAAS